MNKKGQMHTIEALLALMLIISVVTFAAHSGPRRAYVGGSVDTQLVLYGEDFLGILDMERSSSGGIERYKSWLYHQVNGTVNGSDWNGAANITQEWRKTTLNDSGVFCKVEIANFTSSGLLTIVDSYPPYANPPENSITVTRLVTLVEPVRVYEVKLTLWYL